MNTFIDKLVDEVEIVLQGVLSFLWTGDITAVADNSLTNTTSFFSCIDTQSHLRVDQRPEHMKLEDIAYVFYRNGLVITKHVEFRWERTKVVQRVEHPEDIKAVLDSFFGEIVDSIIPGPTVNNSCERNG